jgi:hypothetical protein
MGGNYCSIATFRCSQRCNSFHGSQQGREWSCGELGCLVIDALYEWESVYGGQFTNEEVADRTRKLMQLRHEANVRQFPTENLPEREDLLALAEADAIAYFVARFGPFETVFGPSE